MSFVLVNGEDSDRIFVTDRGLQYGDGIFETIRIKSGTVQHWRQHMSRLQRGCERLGISIPEIESLHAEAMQLITRYGKERDAVLKLIVTRGSGPRGYKPSATAEQTRIIALYPFPNYPENYRKYGVKITICKTRLACNRRLAGVKHLNRLEQVLASSEWQDNDIVDGVMLDKDEHVIEGTLSNIFWVAKGKLYTPNLEGCGVEGVMRNLVLCTAGELQKTVTIGHYFIEDLLSADEIFITNSIHGIWPVRQIDQYSYEPGPITKQLMDAIP
ncbi:aminodeoxychorismate lyase [Kaarinaea lacus]